jgi:hypothetical protein
MLQTKRGADDDPLESLSESSKKIRNCTGGGETLDPLVSGLLHFIFPQMFFTDIMGRHLIHCFRLGIHCFYRWVRSGSGIAIQRKVCSTRFLTSASLVRALNNSKSRGHDNLEVGAANHPSLILLVCLT